MYGRSELNADGNARQAVFRVVAVHKGKD